MRGEHKAGYRRPRTGEKRETRQPLKIDKLPPEVGEKIQQLRAQGKTWEEISELSTGFAGQPLTSPSLIRWYDLRVEQVKKETLAQAERARAMAAAFVGKDFKDLPEAALNALSAEVFAVMEAEGSAKKQASLGNLVFIISKMMAARAAEERVALEREKIALAKRKFDELKAKAEKATNEAAAKIGKGRRITIEDIDRIRERTFGLPPVGRKPPAGPAAV